MKTKNYSKLCIYTYLNCIGILLSNQTCLVKVSLSLSRELICSDEYPVVVDLLSSVSEFIRLI